MIKVATGTMEVHAADPENITRVEGEENVQVNCTSCNSIPVSHLGGHLQIEFSRLLQLYMSHIGHD